MNKVSYYMFLLPLFAALMTIGCKDDKESSVPVAFTITATIDGNLGIVWQAGDELRVVCADETYTFVTTQSGSESAQFTAQVESVSAIAGGSSPVIAYVHCATLDGNFNIPAEQTVREGVNTTRIPMYAHATSGANNMTLNFKALASVLELEIEPVNLVAEKLTIAPAEDAQISDGVIAGAFRVNAQTGAVTSNSSAAAITVNFDGGLNVSQSPKVRIPLGWFAIDGGLEISLIQGNSTFTMTIWDENGTVRTYTEGTGGVRQARLLTQSPSMSVNVTAAIEGNLGIEWETGDEIKLVCAGEVFTFTAVGDGLTAQFICADELSTLMSGSSVSAYANFETTDGGFEIPSQRESTDNAVPMFAYIASPDANNLHFTFRPIASILELDIEPNDLVAESITISAAQNATISNGSIAGEFTINAANGTVTVTNPDNSVTINFAGGLNIEQGAKVRIPVGWFTVNGGLEISMKQGADTHIMTIWENDGAVSTFVESGGLRQARMISQFVSAVVQTDFYVKADGLSTSRGLSWDAPTTLTSALENASNGSTIHVAAGTYFPENEITGRPLFEETKTFEISRNVAIIGGYPANATTGAVSNPALHKTILDGNEKSFHVVLVVAPVIENQKVIIKGVTVRNGFSTDDDTTTTPIDGFNLEDRWGTGLAILGTRLDLIDCVITENRGREGVGIFSRNAEVTISGCEISDNHASNRVGGAYFRDNGKLTMENTVIKNNTSFGNSTGLWLMLNNDPSWNLTAELTNVTIIDNEAGVGNTAAGGNSGIAILSNNATNKLRATLTNCVISDNVSSGASSAVNVANAHVTFIGCTISGNTSGTNGAIVINTWEVNGGDVFVLFDRCVIKDNIAGATNGWGTIYFQNNNTTAGNNNNCELIILNSTFSNNASGQRGGAIAIVNDGANGGAMRFTCVNSTFTGNRVRAQGGAIGLYKGSNTGGPIIADIISCTFTGNRANTGGTETNRGGAISMERSGNGIASEHDITLRSYNNLFAGNFSGNAATPVLNDFHEWNPFDGWANNFAGYFKHRYTIMTQGYNAFTNVLFDGTGESSPCDPPFNATTMLGALGDNGGSTPTIRLLGAAATNPAFGNGMTATELEAFASQNVPTSVLRQDQTGAQRNSTRIIGACVR